MKGADGVIFVADSQRARKEANIISMEDLYENLQEYGYDPLQVPAVIQYNKRDLPDAVPVEELRAQLNPGGLEDYEAVAVEGLGVFDTLKAVGKLVIKSLS